MSRLAIVTVVYKNYTVLEDYVKSLRIQTDKNFKVFMVDLTEEPRQKIPSLARDDTQFGKTILHSSNKGYAHGVNVGLKQALKEGLTEFCVMNSDTYFEEDFVANIKRTLSTHPQTICGGKIYYAAGYEYHKDQYDKKDLGNVIWFAGGRTDWDHAITNHIGVDKVDEGQFDEEKKVDFITGCLLFFDKAVLDKVGMWNETYFLYYEDADWCVRAIQKGVPLMYIPTVTLWHKNAQSTNGSGSAIHTSYQKKNRIKFGLKYAPLKTKVHLLRNAVTRRNY